MDLILHQELPFQGYTRDNIQDNKQYLHVNSFWPAQEATECQMVQVWGRGCGRWLVPCLMNTCSARSRWAHAYFQGDLHSFVANPRSRNQPADLEPLSTRGISLSGVNGGQRGRQGGFSWEIMGEGIGLLRNLPRLAVAQPTFYFVHTHLVENTNEERVFMRAPEQHCVCGQGEKILWVRRRIVWRKMKSAGC